ncbi:MAG: hypothetical protein LAP61_15585 [Acidobacteriia bacterium]|nr:hypothetical protein [Terriglobia bacterium]
MRRALAVALLGLFSFSLIPPSAFASDPEAGLPACCRRNGKHHCTMPVEGPSSGPALHASPCCSFPGTSGVTTSPKAGVLTAPVVSCVSHASTLAKRLEDVTPHPVLFHSPRQQRGPPAHSLS